MSKTQEQIINQFVEVINSNQIKTQNEANQLIIRLKDEVIKIKKPVNSLRSSTGSRSV